MASVLPSLIEDNSDDPEADLESLFALIFTEDEVGALAWLDEQVPGIMKRIPARRRLSFIGGLADHVRETGEL